MQGYKIRQTFLLRIKFNAPKSTNKSTQAIDLHVTKNPNRKPNLNSGKHFCSISRLKFNVINKFLMVFDSADKVVFMTTKVNGTTNGT